MSGSTGAARRAAAAFDGPFLLRLAAGCFATGAAMELFMIKTGFYEKVVNIEAERMRELRQAVEEGRAGPDIDIRKLLEEKFK
eukprot:PRCOL_00001285-RA